MKKLLLIFGVVFVIGVLIYSLKYAGQFCGGIVAFGCPVGYECKSDGPYPDAGGNCRFNPIFTFIEFRNKLR